MRLSTLVLDQNADAANMLADQLRHAGIRITVASSATDALKQVLLTDSSMPDGLKVARRLGVDALLQAPSSVNELARRLAAFDRRDRPMF